MTLCVGLLSGGCATRALWGLKDCTPTPDPQIGLAFSPDKYDFLVTYHEQRESEKFTRTNAYWLLANIDHPAGNHRPAFIQGTNLPALVTIPIFKWNEPLPEAGYSARVFVNGAFELYHNSVDIGRFWLPNYSTPAEPATASRILLTPPAVLADTLIVSSIVAIYVSPYVLEAYANSH